LLKLRLKISLTDGDSASFVYALFFLLIENGKNFSPQEMRFFGE
jgi:hypothetical protein